MIAFNEVSILAYIARFLLNASQCKTCKPRKYLPEKEALNKAIHLKI
jgi:hypothetical protein